MTGCGILWKRGGIRGGRPNFSADANLHIELSPGAFFGYNEKRVNAHGGGDGVCAIFWEETARERAAVRITRSARTCRSCQRGDALSRQNGGRGLDARGEKAYTVVQPKKRGPGGERSAGNRRKNPFVAPKMTECGFWPPACDHARSDRGTRRRIKSGAKFWRIKLILSALCTCTSRLLSGACGEKWVCRRRRGTSRDGRTHFGRVKSSGWAAAFFRTTPVFYILCAERFRDARARCAHLIEPVYLSDGEECRTTDLLEQAQD